MNDFAKKYWREFEKLFKIVIDNLLKKNHEINSFLTQKSKDGGYDLLVLINSDKFEEQLSLLGEAKLRNFNQNDLPLSAFSKTFIVAVNLLVNYVIIATNIRFTDNTVTVIDNFSKRTGIQCDLLDLNDIKEWIANHPNEINSIDTNLIKELNQHQMPKKIKQKINILDINKSRAYEELIGDERRKLLDEIVNYIQFNSSNTSHYIIESYSGLGKTVFIRNIVKRLSEANKRCYCIDLSRFSISRDLFIEFLSIIWCVSKENILLDCSSLIDETLLTINKKYLDENTKQAIKNILSLEETKFNNESNYWDMLLLESLFKISTPIINRIHPVIVFENYDKTNKKVHQFASKLFNYFQTSNLCFIIERQKYIDGVESFDNNSNVHKITLPNLRNIECKNLLKLKYDNIPDDIEPIINICSNNPLYLLNLFPILPEIQDTDIFKEINQNNLLYNEKLVSQYLKTSMEKQFECLEVKTKKIIAIIGLLDGELSYDQLNIITNNENYSESINCLSKLEYFEIISDKIIVKNLIYLKYIKQYNNYLTLFDVNTVMNLVLTFIDYLKIDLFSKNLLLFDIYCYLKKEDCIISIMKQVINQLILLSEFQRCLTLLKKAYDIIYTTLDINNKIWINNKIMYCYVMLDDYRNKQLTIHIEEQNKFFEFNKELYYLDYLEYIYIYCKLLLALGRYQDILDLTTPIIFDSSKLNEIEERIIRMRFLAIKHLNTMDDALRYLRDKINNYNTSIILNYTLLTHESNISKGNIDASIKYFNKITKYYSQITLDEQEHNENNIAVCYFYQKKYEKSINKAKYIQNFCFLNNLKIEEGRAYHTIAMNYVALDQINGAINHFENSLNIFKRNYHTTHIWPVYINLSTLYLKYNNRSKSLNCAYKALNHLRENYMNSLKLIQNIEICNQPKYYIGLLIVLYNILEITQNIQETKKIVCDFGISKLKDDFQVNILENKLKQNLENSIYNINNYLILKI